MTTYDLLARVDSIHSKSQSIIVLLILVGDLERGCFEARGENKHVLEFSFLHIVGKAYHKDGRDLLLAKGAVASAVAAIETVGSADVGAARVERETIAGDASVAVETRAQGRGGRRLVVLSRQA